MNIKDLSDRLDIIRTSAWYEDFEIPSIIFENCKHIFKYLEKYLLYLHPDEIGPSNNGTMILYFENDKKSLALEIGINSIAHVISDSSDVYISGEGLFKDIEYWERIKEELEKIKLDV